MIVGFRIFLCLVGLLFLVFGSLLYEDEERKVQTRLGDFWIWLDDKRKLALRTEQNFVSESASRVSDILSRLFGPELISFRAFGTSVALSVLCASLLSTPRYVFVAVATRKTHALYMLLPIVALGVGMMLRGLFQEDEGMRLANTTVGRLIGFLVISLMFGLDRRLTPSFAGWNSHLGGTAEIFIPPLVLEIFMLVILAVSTLADYCVLAFFRLLLRRASLLVRDASFAVIAIAVALAGLLWYLPYRLSFHAHGPGVGPLLRILSSLNATDGIVLASAFALLVLLNIHHILWPFLMRPLYAIQRITGATARKALCTLGLSFITAAIAFGSKHLSPIWEAVEKIIGT